MGVIVAAWVVLGCSECQDGSCAVRLEFEGRNYFGIAADAFDIHDGDVTVIGHGRAFGAPLVDDQVYALGGVAPTDAVAMRADVANGSALFYVFVRDMGPAPSAPSIWTLPGLCAYARAAPPECTTTDSTN